MGSFEKWRLIFGRQFHAVITGLLLVLLFQNCSPLFKAKDGANEKSDVKSNPAVLSPPPAATPKPFKPKTGITDVKFWGFWASAMSGAGTGNYIAETEQYRGNTVMVREDDPTKALLKIQQAKSLNLNVILFVDNIFFPWASSVIHTDYDSKFNSYWNTISEYENTIVGFYVADEPYWKNVSAGWNRINTPFLQDTLNFISRYLKQKFPSKLTFMTFAYTELDDDSFFSTMNPRDVDVIGFNCYLAMDRCTDEYIKSTIHKMQLNKTAQQKMLLTADGYWNETPNEATDLRVLQRMRLWRSLAGGYGDVIAYFPFLFQNVPSERLYGLEAMPHSLGETALHFAALSGSAVCSTDDYISYDEMRKIIGTWTNAPICVPKCEGRDSVRRTATGILVGTWVSAPQCQ